ncbi:GntR family transcriptional regulator [Ornithinibacillus gellani]|uniref:GntR family transcriptional regulator n=1 Tax=Ornithinibacillus gellani TaxID=2293253 RepID=UPI000F4648AB|nr:GntR family transcriptional regulator [Ornithinibacillus gellani]TQS71075.1 GntR family transcriptional regulator [Ornithinibacillus gellani]
MNLHLKQGPLYLQVKDILKERIITGRYAKNELIPPEPELEREFGVSKITIRKAVEQLVQEGYVEKRSGIGTTVLDNHAVSKLSKGQRFSEYLLEEGYMLQKQLIDVSIVTADLHAIKAFGKRAYCIERLYTLNDKPYIHFKHYISGDIDLPNNRDYFTHSLYEILYEQGVRFHRFKDEFGVAVPDEKIAELLQIEQQPLLHRERFSYDLGERLIEYSVAFYNTAVHKYIVNLNV